VRCIDFVDDLAFDIRVKKLDLDAQLCGIGIIGNYVVAEKEGGMMRLDTPEVAAYRPWVPFAGIGKAPPDFEAILEHIAEEHRRRDAAASEA
jgi:hypothetical protein